MDPRCTHCGSSELEPGFLVNTGESASRTKWIVGPAQLGVFGGLRMQGKQRRDIEAMRCSACSHLELFVPPPATPWPPQAPPTPQDA